MTKTVRPLTATLTMMSVPARTVGIFFCITLFPSLAIGQAELPAELISQIVRTQFAACAQAEASSSVEELERMRGTLDHFESRARQSLEGARRDSAAAQGRVDDLRASIANSRANLERAEEELDAIRARLELRSNLVIDPLLTRSGAGPELRRQRDRIALLQQDLRMLTQQTDRGMVQGPEGLELMRQARAALQARIRQAQSDLEQFVRDQADRDPAIMSAQNDPELRELAREEALQNQSIAELEESIRRKERELREAEDRLASSLALLELHYEEMELVGRYYDGARRCIDRRLAQLRSPPIVTGPTPTPPPAPTQPSTIAFHAGGEWSTICSPVLPDGGTRYGVSFLLDVYSDGRIQAAFAYSRITGHLNVTGTLAADGTVQGRMDEAAGTVTWAGQLTRSESGAGTIRLDLHNPTYTGTCAGRWWTSDRPRPADL